MSRPVVPTPEIGLKIVGVSQNPGSKCELQFDCQLVKETNDDLWLLVSLN